ncbi:MAG: hypothetical protein NNA23_08070 [Nitrospira sp.]|nr:hypothetical protein [Nitrospira sp.]MCP9465250.1 hypothetical protein [Nitrospira sp.]
MVLSLLLSVFCLRVAAQMLQPMSPVAWLPPFEAWVGGGLPYWRLVLCQVLVIMVCGRAV